MWNFPRLVSRPNPLNALVLSCGVWACSGENASPEGDDSSSSGGSASGGVTGLNSGSGGSDTNSSGGSGPNKGSGGSDTSNTGGTNGTGCTNIRPTGTEWDEASCEDWATQTSECNTAWMIENNYCNQSCGRCVADGSGGTGSDGTGSGGTGSGGTNNGGASSNPFTGATLFADNTIAACSSSSAAGQEICSTPQGDWIGRDDGWINLRVRADVQGGQVLACYFDYHQEQIPTGNGVLLLSNQFVVTPHIVREAIQYGLKQGWTPLERGAELNLRHIDDKIGLRLGQNREETIREAKR